MVIAANKFELLRPPSDDVTSFDGLILRRFFHDGLTILLREFRVRQTVTISANHYVELADGLQSALSRASFSPPQ